MGARPLTIHDAERIRREWAAGRADLDDVTRALDQLVHALGVADRARRLIAQLAGGPWPGIRQAVTGIEEWLADTAPEVVKPAAAPRRRW